MKDTICLISTLILSSFCGQQKEQIEKFVEDGVEVVINHIEPYKVGGEF